VSEIIKYLRTPHIEGSRLQPGDEDLSQIPFASIAGMKVVVEEKCDGSNAAISFNEVGNVLLQNRGHCLTGGYREKQFNLMKQWQLSIMMYFIVSWEADILCMANGCMLNILCFMIIFRIIF